MIQYGNNAGPWHLRIYGLVNNLLPKQKLSVSEQHMKDERILGAFGITWAILQNAMPREVTDACDQTITASGMPSMTHGSDSNSKFLPFLICNDN